MIKSITKIKRLLALTFGFMLIAMQFVLAQQTVTGIVRSIDGDVYLEQM